MVWFSGTWDRASWALGMVTQHVGGMCVIARVFLVGLRYFVLGGHGFGLRPALCGCEPGRRRVVWGVNVYKYKYLAVITSGGLPLEPRARLSTSRWSRPHVSRTQTQGRGSLGFLGRDDLRKWIPGVLAMGARACAASPTALARGPRIGAVLILDGSPFTVAPPLMALWKAVPASQFKGDAIHLRGGPAVTGDSVRHQRHGAGARLMWTPRYRDQPGGLRAWPPRRPA
ncbi:hypothetical protein GCM10020229_84850 [Kitasatospora albolonga]